MALANLSELTEGTISGNGAFDKLMEAAKAHIQQEFQQGRIRGPEYADVYLGMLQSTMNTGLSWLVQGANLDLQRELLEQQVILAKIEAQKAEIEMAKVQVELELLNLQKPKLAAEVELIQAQVIQMEAENALIPKKAALMDAEVLYKEKQGEMIISEIANSVKQGELIDSQKLKISQEISNLEAEALNVPKQGAVLDAQKAQISQQTENLAAEELNIAARTILVTRQADNETIQGTVLVAQECKLRAEFDLTMSQVTKSTSEIGLLTQKTLTEKAQTQAIGVDPDSVIGRQKALYAKQAEGFDRDAEQKAAKLMIDTWNTRRMTDDATVADGTNQLNDVNIGKFVTKLAQGIGA